MKPPKYLIVSLENISILLMTESIVIANALVSGSGDEIVRYIDPIISADYDVMTEEKFNEGFYTMDGKNRNRLVLLPDEYITDSLREKKKVLNIRKYLLEMLESFTASALVRQVRHKWSEFDLVAMEQIKQSDPTTGNYTWMMEEYSRIMGMPVEHAYKELKIRIESDILTKFRVQTLAEKWKEIINQTTSDSDKNTIITGMGRDFWKNNTL